MTKVSHTPVPTSPYGNPCGSYGGHGETSSELDTLAQLRKPSNDGGYTEGQKSYQKRARAKAITNAVVYKMVDVASPLNKSYWSSWHCSRAVLQDGNKITSRYCNQRWCLVCNRIRTAKLMNGYLPALGNMVNPQFVTLTVPNVDGAELKVTIETMTKTFRQCLDVMRKRGVTPDGIRKSEVTVNEVTQLYHPHFHLIVDGEDNANDIVKLWLAHNPNSSPIAQDVRPCTDAKELFKYFTKLLTKSGQFLPVHMDVIFQAMKGKRVYQPFGTVRKVSEDVDATEAVTCDWKAPQDEIWVYEDAAEFSDWYNSTGEALTEVVHSAQTMALIEVINARAPT